MRPPERDPISRAQCSASTRKSIARVTVATSSGSIAGNIPIRSWLRPSLRYGSVSTIPLARSAPATAAASTDSSKSIVARHAAPRRRLRDKRCREGPGFGPPVQDLCRPIAPRRAPLEAAVVEHPFERVGEHEQGRQRGSVVRLIEAASSPTRSARLRTEGSSDRLRRCARFARSPPESTARARVRRHRAKHFCGAK